MDSDVEARKLVGADLGRPRQELPPLPAGRYYVADLVGMRVEDETGGYLGRLQAIFPSGAHDLYEVKPESGSAFLVPAVKEFIKQVDLEKRRLVIHLIPGIYP